MKRYGRASLTAFLFAIILTIAGPAIFAIECPLAPGTEDYATPYASKIGLPRCKAHNVKKWSACEICMISSKDYSTSATNPYQDSYFGAARLQPSATFMQPDTPSVTVAGFFDGFSGNNAVFRIRFTPTVNPGNTITFSTMSSDPGMNNMTGTFTVDNRASVDRGFLRQDSNNPRTFVWDDGSHPFVWGNTFYQIVNHARLPQSQEGVWKNAITQSRARGLNKIRLLVSPWGKDPRPEYAGADSKAFATINDVPGGPLNYDKLDLLNWEALDRVVNFLKQQGMIADLILFHDGENTSSPFVTGKTLDSREKNRRFTHYVVARYGAFPNVIWTLSNEYQNVKDGDKAQWDDLGCVIRGCGDHAPAGAADPWLGSPGAARPLSIHNNISNGDNGNPRNPGYPCFEFFGAPGWATDIVLQTRRNQASDPVPPSIDQLAGQGILRNVYNATGNNCAGLTDNSLPIVNDEYGYIGENGVTQAEHRQAAWAVAAAGGFGSIGDLQKQVAGEDCDPDKPDNQPCSPTLYTAWTKFPQPPHYNDIQSLIDYFTKSDNKLDRVWWQLKTVLQGELTADYNAHVYGSRGPKDAVVYAVHGDSTPTIKFSLKLKPGEYQAVFKDLATGTATTALSQSQTKRGTRLVSIPFQTTFPTAWTDVVTHIKRTKSFSADKAAIADDDTVDETPWVWDELPAGGVPGGAGENWNWIEDNPVPISDNRAHVSNLVLNQMHQHFFTGAYETLPVAAGDYLYAYIYLDKDSPPSEVMLQWYDGNWEHRAYWGANQITSWGVNGTNSRRYMGALPLTGRWVRLEVPASAVGLEGHTLNGMAFTLFGGKATWDEAGRAGASAPQCDESFITQQPQSQTIIPGASATLSVAVSGTADFNYQFYQAPVGVYQNPTGISTATISTGPIYTTKEYWAEINDTCQGTFLRSEAAIITVQCTAAPTITQQPTSRVVTTPGQYTTLSVSSYQGVNYQWYSGGSPISGATAPTLSVNPQSTTTYWARVTNGCGSVDSAIATVCVKPQINVQPAPRTINPGQSTTLSVTAVNAASYQWYTGTAPSTATPILNATGSALTVSPTANTNYWVKVINSCDTVDSNTVTVTVVPVPSAQISRIQSVSVLANSQQSVTARWTQPTQPNTFLVAVISGLKDPAQLAWTAPAGWQLATDQEWPNVKLAIYYLPNNAGARTAETFTVAQGYHDMTLYIAEYSGMAAVNPLDRIGGTGDTTNNGYVQTGFTPTTSQAKELVITALSTYTQTEFSVAPIDGYAELYDQYMLYHLTTAMYEKIASSIGSYGHGATVYVPAEWAGVVATFRGAN